MYFKYFKLFVDYYGKKIFLPLTKMFVRKRKLRRESEKEIYDIMQIWENRRKRIISSIYV